MSLLTVFQLYVIILCFSFVDLCVFFVSGLILCVFSGHHAFVFGHFYASALVVIGGIVRLSAPTYVHPILVKATSQKSGANVHLNRRAYKLQLHWLAYNSSTVCLFLVNLSFFYHRVSFWLFLNFVAILCLFLVVE